MSELFCWNMYELRNWSMWSRPMRLIISILPIVVFGIVGYRTFKKDRFKVFVSWADLKWLVILLIPWAFSQAVGIVFYTLCYSR